MQSVVFFGKNDIRLTESPVPTPGRGDVLLKVLLAGVCATDRHIVEGHFSVRPPRILGHEIVGVVEAVGPGAAQEWLGKLCGVRPARFCGSCSMCQIGEPQLCKNFECLGNTRDGGYAEYTLAQTAQLVHLENIKPEAAVWLEPLACVLQALEKIDVSQKRGPMLILGAGVLGKLMLQVILSTTRAQVAVIDPNAKKVAAAIELGAHTGWTIPRQGTAPETSTELLRWAPGGPLVIIDTTGSPEAIQRAIDWASPSGRILLFGVSDPTAMLSISPHQIFSKEITLLASSGMSPASFDAAYAMLRSEQIDPTRLVSLSIGLDDLPAYLLGQAPKQEGKILVRPGFQAEHLK